jgi:hypothetical protein
LVASVTNQEAKMLSQLNYLIAKEHHAELVRDAERGRLIADTKTGHSKRQTTTALRSLGGRITAVVHRTPRAASDAS